MLLTIVGFVLLLFALATIWTRGYGPQGETTYEGPGGKLKVVFPSLVVLFLGVALLVAGQVELPASSDDGRPQAHADVAAPSPSPSPSPRPEPSSTVSETSAPPAAPSGTVDDAEPSDPSAVDGTAVQDAAPEDETNGSGDADHADGTVSDDATNDSTNDSTTTDVLLPDGATTSTGSMADRESLDSPAQLEGSPPLTSTRSADGANQAQPEEQPSPFRSGPWTSALDGVQLVVERVRPGKGVGGRLRVYLRVENDSADDISLAYDDSFLVVDTAGNSYGFDDEHSTFPLVEHFWGELEIESHHTRAGYLLLDEKVPHGTTSLQVRVVFTAGYTGPSTRLMAEVPIDARTQRSPQ